MVRDMSYSEPEKDRHDQRPAGAERQAGEISQMRDSYGDEYTMAVGAVVQARKAYESACIAFGVDSWGAEQAKEYLDRQITYRNEMRALHDQAEGPYWNE